MHSFLNFLKKNKLYTAINITGLTVSMAFVLLLAMSTYYMLQERRNVAVLAADARLAPGLPLPHRPVLVDLRHRLPAHPDRLHPHRPVAEHPRHRHQPRRCPPQGMMTRRTLSEHYLDSADTGQMSLPDMDLG